MELLQCFYREIAVTAAPLLKGDDEVLMVNEMILQEARSCQPVNLPCRTAAQPAVSGALLCSVSRHKLPCLLLLLSSFFQSLFILSFPMDVKNAAAAKSIHLHPLGSVVSVVMQISGVVIESLSAWS